MSQSLTDFYLQPVGKGEHLRLNSATGEVRGSQTNRLYNGERVTYEVPAADSRHRAELDTYTVPTVADFMVQRGWASILLPLKQNRVSGQNVRAQ